MSNKSLAVPVVIKPLTASRQLPVRRSFNVSGEDYVSMVAWVKLCKTFYTQHFKQNVFDSPSNRALGCVIVLLAGLERLSDLVMMASIVVGFKKLGAGTVLLAAAILVTLVKKGHPLSAIDGANYRMLG